MSAEIRKVSKFFWAWQDEEEEAWLEQMSLDGWHLSNAQLLGRYEFEEGEPKHYAYRLDFITDRGRYGEYLQLFRDAGWKHLGEMAGWQYFRKEIEPGEKPEIFTDNESKAQKYRRLIAFLLILLGANVPAMSLLSQNGLYQPLKMLFIAVVGVLTFAIIRLYQRIKELRSL